MQRCRPALSLLVCAALGAACSSNTPDSNGGAERGPGNVEGSAGASGGGNGGGAAPQLVGNPGLPPAPGQPGAPEYPVIEQTPGFEFEGNITYDNMGMPLNIGTELLCDGIDENNNGIIDDVDSGKDGLCDCLRIGFLGTVASDAGNATAAFETWLADRSDIPVRHFAPGDVLAPGAFDGIQVMVVGNLSQRANSGGYSAAEVQVLADWVRVTGGGMITLAGYTARETDIVPTVQLLAPTGLSYDYVGRGPGVLGVGAPPMISRGVVAPDHPSMNGLVAMGIYNAYPVIGDGEVIVREGNLNLAMSKAFGEGQVFAFSDEWITQDSLWYPLENRQLTQCQQGCNQCANQCNQCDQNCTNCQAQPCNGGQVNVDAATCARGCDQGCASCQTQCQACEAVCQECAADELNDRLDIPRFWLNTLRWLTPENECKVPLPPPTIF